MQRRSDQDVDGLAWDTASLRVGAAGLDLRRPNEPTQLSELLNARFLDERTAARRQGHTGYVIRTGESYAGGEHSDRWVYGHGNTVPSGAGLDENTYIPRHRRGGMVFRFGDGHVAWTGDRLVILREDDAPGIGESSHWGDSTERGIPAFLPVQRETPVQFGVAAVSDFTAASDIDTCLTSTFRVVAHSDAIYLYDRETGVEVAREDFDGVIIRCVNSGDVPTVVYLTAANELTITHWTGSAWSTPSPIASAVGAFDTAETEDGFHLFYRSGSDLFLGKYIRATPTNAPYPFDTAITGPAGTANGPVGVGVAPSGELGLTVSTDTGVWARALSASASALTGASWLAFGLSPAPADHLSIVSRGLSGGEGRYRWVVHCDLGGNVKIWTYSHTSLGAAEDSEETRFNCTLATKGFRVGDEVFAWLHATSVHTMFLLAGAIAPVVAGYADRLTAITRDYSTYTVLPDVHRDPLDEYALTWTRPYFTGLEYSHPGNALVGDLQFLPRPTAVPFGLSVYISGSAVKNWDGHSLEDAGYHEYPLVDSHTLGSGSLSAGNYQWRVYPARYNAQGERFQGPAMTYTVNGVTSGQSVTLTINSMPSAPPGTVLEVYRTQAGGTSFTLEGSVANDLTAATVEFVSTLSDSAIIGKAGDPHQGGPAGLRELEQWGPTGCEVLVPVGDRLWAIGGQVRRGAAAFSKLWESGEGPGFDDLAGYLVVDAEAGELTSMIGMGQSIIFFQRDRLSVVRDYGPDNYGNGAFPAPEFSAADGATTHFGTARIQGAAVYWGEDGPRLLSEPFQSVPICRPVQPLSEALVPSGVQVNLSRQEVVWYTEGGDALLWSYAGGNSRWARWNGLAVAGANPSAVITTDGVVLVESEDAEGDDGHHYEFKFATGNLRPEDILQGHTHIRSLGLVGEHQGSHRVRFRVYYDNSPLWSEQFEWTPEERTWLTSGDDLSDLTPAQVDALLPTDRSGQYDTHRRLRRQMCSLLRVEVSDMGSSTPTFIPYALSFELGAKPGLGRTPVNKFER